MCECVCGSMKTMSRLCGKLCEFSLCRQLLNINKETNMSNGRLSIPSSYGENSCPVYGEKGQRVARAAKNARIRLALVSGTAISTSSVY